MDGASSRHACCEQVGRHRRRVGNEPRCRSASLVHSDWHSKRHTFGGYAAVLSCSRTALWMLSVLTVAFY